MYSGIYGATLSNSGDYISELIVYDGEIWDHAYDNDGNIIEIPATASIVDTLNNDLYLLSIVMCRYDGEHFHIEGFFSGGAASAACYYNKDLYIGGGIKGVSNHNDEEFLPANYIVKWDGNNWSDVAGGVDSNVKALITYEEDLLVGGFFDTIISSNIQANGVARYNEPYVENCRWLKPRIQTQLHVDTFYLNSNNPELEIGFVNNNAYADSWSWSFDAEQSSFNEDTVSFVYSQPGTYTVSVIVEQEGCVKTAEKQIVVEDITGISTNIESVKIYPNPVLDILHIKLNVQNDFIDLSVYDLNGKLLKTDSIPSGTVHYELNVKGLPKGNYVLDIAGKRESFVKM